MQSVKSVQLVQLVQSVSTIQLVSTVQSQQSVQSPQSAQLVSVDSVATAFSVVTVVSVFDAVTGQAAQSCSHCVTVRVRVEVTVYNQKSLYLIAVSVMHNCSLNLGFSHCYTTLGQRFIAVPLIWSVQAQAFFLTVKAQSNWVTI